MSSKNYEDPYYAISSILLLLSPSYVQTSSSATFSDTLSPCASLVSTQAAYSDVFYQGQPESQASCFYCMLFTS